MAKPGRLILVRHGESESNFARSFSASPDIELTERGLQQAHEVARRIKARFTPQAVLSSHFRRARQTADIIGTELNLTVEVLDDIHERDLGTLRGHAYETLRAMVKQAPNYDPAKGWLWRPQDGESYEDVRIRALAAFERLRLRFPEHETVVVSHGGVMLAMWAHLTGQWRGAHLPPNCGIVLIEHDGERFHAPRIIED
jgi:broad specificity phosphatase PhoE